MLEFFFVVALLGILWAWVKIMNRLEAEGRRIALVEAKVRDLHNAVRMVAKELGFSDLSSPMAVQGRPAITEAFARLGEKVESLRLSVELLRAGPAQAPSITEKPTPRVEVPPQPVLPLDLGLPKTSKEPVQVDQPPIPVTVPEKRTVQPESPTVPPLGPQPFVETRRLKQPLPRAFDWESFTGVKLFAWLGGLAFFLGASFFVKYSIEHDLISPMLRVILGTMAGVAAIGSGLGIRKSRYAITAQTLCASGVAILYSSIFAAHTFYQFIDATPALLLMTLVTVAAFLLAVRLNSMYVAILGLAGGFLTPPLLSTGVDRPVELFIYIALLDLGLAAIALRNRWGLLLSLSSLGTLVTQIGWANRFFDVSKESTGIVIFSFFALLYTGLDFLSRRLQRESTWILAPAFVMPLVSMGFAGYLLSFPQLERRPAQVLSFLFLMDALVALVAFFSRRFRSSHTIAGILAFLLLLIWTTEALTPSLLPLALAFFFAFAASHALFPVAWQSWRPETPSPLWESLFPILMLFPILVFVASHSPQSYLVWPFILLINLTVLPICIITATTWIIGLSMLLTFGIAWAWLHHLQTAHGLPGLSLMLGSFSLLFYGIGLLMDRSRSLGKMLTNSGRESAASPLSPGINLRQLPQLPALSALLPFFLLLVACIQLPLIQPAPVLGLGLVLTILLLGLVHYLQADEISVVALGSVALLLYVWQFTRFDSSQPMMTLPWYGAFLGVFLGYPFLFHRRMGNRLIPWVTSASAGPVLFYVLYELILNSWGDRAIGLLPAGLALVYGIALLWFISRWPRDSALRQTLLAVFGGVTLLFVSLVFPVQFGKEWITIGWALEGLALVWYFHKVPHPGLKIWGGVLLAFAFVRLALNPAVLDYHPRTGTPILNWYLYAYGVVSASCFLGAWLWRPRNETVLGKPAAFWLYLKGTCLLFLLLNVEIADYFSLGEHLTFEFSGNFARDMSYSLAWALFAFLLLLVGVWARSRAARFGSLGLLLLAAVKVFLHDLWRLGQLYRVVSLVGLAVFLIVVSFLYQRYLSGTTEEKSS